MLRQAYTEFAEQLDTSGTPKQFYQTSRGSKRYMQAADTQSSRDQENVTPHQLAEQEIARRLLSREQVKKQLQLQQ